MKNGDVYFEANQLNRENITDVERARKLELCFPRHTVSDLINEYKLARLEYESEGW